MISPILRLNPHLIYYARRPLPPRRTRGHRPPGATRPVGAPRSAGTWIAAQRGCGPSASSRSLHRRGRVGDRGARGWRGRARGATDAGCTARRRPAANVCARGVPTGRRGIIFFAPASVVVMPRAAIAAFSKPHEPAWRRPRAPRRARAGGMAAGGSGLVRATVPSTPACASPRTRAAPALLLRVAKLALMPDREYPHDPLSRDESVEGDVPGLPVRDDQLAHLAVHAATDERMGGEHADRGPDGLRRRDRGSRVSLRQKLEGALEIRERVGGVDYLRHGLGRVLFLPRARRSIQPWTSAARYTSPVCSMARSAASASWRNARMR